jgi:hypothetical protein
MAIIQVPTSLYSNDIDGPIKSAYADTNTGKYYWDPSGNSPMVLTVNTGESLEQQWVGTNPKTDPILSDPISVKMLQSGYQPTDMGNVYFNPTTQKYAISRNQEGIDKIWGGFYQSYDPQTGAVIIGDASRGWDIVNRAINYRNSIYQGGDWMSDFLGAAGPAIMMGGIGALAAAPAVAAAIPEAAGTVAAAAPLAEVAAPVGALADANLAGSAAAAEFGGGQAIADLGINPSLAQSLVDAGVPAQLIQNLPSVSTMVQNAAINAATQLVTTGDIDPSKILTSVVTGAAGTAVGSTVAQDVLSATDSDLAASVASGAAKGALQAAITGGDVLNTALASGAASGLGSVAKDAGIPIPQKVINSVVSSVASGQPLDQVLTGAAISVGTGLAKDAISSAYNAYNTDQQASGLQAASDLGNAPTQGFDNNGNPIYRDSSGVWTNAQGVQVDPATGEPTQITTSSESYSSPTAVAGTQDTAPLQYKTDYTGSSVNEAGQVPPVIGDYLSTPTDTATTEPISDQTTGSLPTAQQVMPEVLVVDQQPAETGLPAVSLPNVDTTGMTTTGGSTATSTPVSAPVTTTVPVSGATTTSTSAGGTSGGTGGASGTTAASDFSKYVNPIPSYLNPTVLSTGAVSQASPLWAGIDPKLAEILTQRVAHGGQIHPRLMKVLHERGGELVPGPENRLYMRHAKRGFAVEGPGTGQSDDIPTMLSQDEYVIDADTVAALGDGSSKAGAEALDKMREEIRRHKRSAPVDKIPPKAKSPLEYLKMAKRK